MDMSSTFRPRPVELYRFIGRHVEPSAKIRVNALALLRAVARGRRVQRHGRNLKATPSTPLGANLACASVAVFRIRPREGAGFERARYDGGLS